MKLSSIFLLSFIYLFTTACQPMKKEQKKALSKEQVHEYFETLQANTYHLKNISALTILKKDMTTRGLQWAPIHLAARYKNTYPLEFYLSLKLTPEELNSQNNILKQTPLHVAVNEVKKNRTCINHVKLLIKAGAELNYKDINENTPLDIAKNNNDTELAALLVKQGKISHHDKIASKKTEKSKNIDTKNIDEQEEIAGFFDFLLNFATLDLSSINPSINPLQL